MRVVITGATGNVGTAVVTALGDDPRVASVLGLARRRPDWHPPKTSWAAADVTRDDLVPYLRGADAVVHLAWRVQPSHHQARLQRVNVEGSRRVFEAAARARVPALVHASSVGTYAPGPKEPVDETWPTDGVATSPYSQQKAAVERILDEFEPAHPQMRVVRLRPALVFRHDVASAARRAFLGPLFPNRLLRPGLVPALPRVRGLRVQALHSLDAAQAFRLAATHPVRGAFNLAADPVLDLRAVARLLRARTVPVPVGLARRLVALTWRARLQPTDPGWLDVAVRTPLLDAGRAERELGWRPRLDALAALDELLAGLRAGAGFPTPPLAPGGKGRLRRGEAPPGERTAEGAAPR